MRTPKHALYTASPNLPLFGEKLREMIGIINRCNAFQFPNDYLIACRADGMFFKSLVKSPGGCMVMEMFFLPYHDNLPFI